VHLRITIALLILTSAVAAQQLPDLSNYQHNWLIYNPAFTGSREALSASFFMRQKELTGPGPMYQQVSMHTPLKNEKLALGASYFREQSAGTLSLSGLLNAPFTKETAWLSYAYRIWTGKGRLAFGINAGLTIYGESFEGLTLTDGDDEYFISGEREYLPNIGAGVLYFTETYFVGISVPYFLSRGPERNTIAHDFNKYTGVLSGGYKFVAGENFSFNPTALVLYDVATRSLNYQASINFGVLEEKIWLGAIYKSSNALSFNVNVSLNNQWLLGYSYDHYLDNLNGYFHGSHEIVLRWEFRKSIESSIPFYY
jgi:type IX secretion system PorP/SprF family membrane protein